MTRFSLVSAILLLAVLFVNNVYRARTQSFTTDEAFTYNMFVAPPIGTTLAYYDANNHVVNTLLSRISVALFGVSELTLRLPSLLGGLLYFVGVFLLCRQTITPSWLFLPAVALLAANPFVLDHLSAARGYGMALAFLVLALLAVTRWLARPSLGAMYGAAVALALAVASNLAFAFPGTALALLFLWLGRREGWRLVDHFVLPGIALVFVILVLPLNRAGAASFYLGFHNWGETLEGLVIPSLFHHATPEGVSPRFPVFQALLRDSLMPLIPVVFWLTGAMAAWGLARRAKPSLVELAGGTMVGAVVLVELVHRLFGLPFPAQRTGIYFIPLFILGAFTLLGRLAAVRWELAAPFVVYAALIAGQFALEWNPGYYWEWPSDAGVKRLVGVIKARAPRYPTRVEVSWEIEPTVNFYRRIWDLGWMLPVERRDPEPGADYYLLLPRQAGLVSKLGIQVLQRDEMSGVVLGKPFRKPD